MAPMKKTRPSAPRGRTLPQASPPPLAQEAREALASAADFERQQLLQEALVKYSLALSYEPRLVHAWIRIGYIFLIGLHWQRGIEALQTALALETDSVEALRYMAFAEFNLGRMDDARRVIDRAASLSDDSATWTMRAYIHSSIDKDPGRTLQAYRDWGERVADRLTAHARPLVVADRDPRRKLRIGYVTADFRRHSIAFFMLPVLAHHNHDDVEVHVFSVGPVDEITVSMHKLVPHWHSVAEMGFQALCDYIRDHRIDVLVDLSGHTLGERLVTFAMRAAPVQATWLGFMNTLGMKAMDYRLTDHGTDPAGREDFYVETLFRLQCMASYAPPFHAPFRETPPMLEAGYPTLISLNNSVKLTQEMLVLWGRILVARPDARLIVMVKERTADAAQEAMQHRIEAAGLPIDRVFVMQQQALEQFMELGHIADIALDTSPISGGTTTMHALWMGLPVVCMDAERATDAATARTLQGLGFGGAVGRDADDYVAQALALMDDPQGLVEFRRTCRDKFRASVLMDYKARTAELERAFRLMWLNYLVGEKRWLHEGVDMEQALRECEGLACARA